MYLWFFDMSWELIFGVVSSVILLATTGSGLIGWVINTTRAFTGQLIDIISSIKDLKAADTEVVATLRRIEANDSVQAALIDGLIKKHLESTEKMESIEKQVIELSENMFQVMQRLRMKTRSVPKN